MNTIRKTKTLAISAVTGALYAVLTMALSPLSYGPVQVRVAEALCVIPFFVPQSALGLAAGCMIANLLTGNIYDMIFGSAATLIAGWLTAAAGRKLKAAGENAGKKKKLLCRISACLAPVIINALIVGAVILCAYNGLHLFENLKLYLLYILQIGTGEAIVLFGLGLPLLRFIPRIKIFGDYV